MLKHFLQAKECQKSTFALLRESQPLDSKMPSQKGCKKDVCFWIFEKVLHAKTVWTIGHAED